MGCFLKSCNVGSGANLESDAAEGIEREGGYPDGPPQMKPE